MHRLGRLHVHDGGSLRLRMFALVLVPLIGGAVAAGLQVGDQVVSVRAAGGAEEHIRSAAAIDAARSALQQEILPALTATAAQNPALAGRAASAAPLSTLLAAAKIIGQLPNLRSATDRAVAAVADRHAVAAAGRRFTVELAQVRAKLDDPKTALTSLSATTALLTSMAEAEHGQVTAATGDGINSAAVQTLHDADLTMRATQYAAQELIRYTATQDVFRGSPALSRTSPAAANRTWTQAWGTAAGASAAVSNQTAPGVAARWNAVNASREVRGFNQFLASQIPASPNQPISTMIKLIVQDGARNHAYMTVLAAALDRALAAGRAQSHAAMVSLGWIIAIAALLVLATLAVAILIRRSVTRPLDRLAEQATRISMGTLADVSVGGPREVRTVARALSSSVASLRNVEAQAAAVAAGDLDNPVVRQALPGPLGEVVHSSVASIITAINDRERAQNELAHRAAHDALTELPNRAQALVLIEKALHRAQRASSTTALMFIDLDHFKTINDTFGHAAGDVVLQRAAKRMMAIVRDGDTVARLGGDEFVVLLENVGDENDIVRLAERLIEQVSTEMTIDTRVIHVGASVGIALSYDGSVDADRLLREADAAAYRAKNAGRGRVDVFDDGLRAELSRRADLEEGIAAALRDKEFLLHYQAVIDLKTGRTTGVEALIRWMRPGHGLVGPDDFIPIAEQSSFVNDIGRWVLGEALGQLRRWDQADENATHLTMAVNISGRHLASNQLVGDVSDALTRSGIDPSRLVVEVTETVVVDNPIATRNMEALRDLGVRIAIDDFGTGFTSIGQLPRLPVDSLKIDRTFIASNDRAHQELVRLIVAAAHAFGLSVVAEGIEYQDQADRLRQAEVEWGQGFLFAHPAPPAALSPRQASPVTFSGSTPTRSHNRSKTPRHPHVTPGVAAET